MARNDGIDRTFARNQDLPTLDDVAKVQEHNEREKDTFDNVQIGENVELRDFICPPHFEMLNTVFLQKLVGRLFTDAQHLTHLSNVHNIRKFSKHHAVRIFLRY